MRSLFSLLLKNIPLSIFLFLFFGCKSDPTNGPLPPFSFDVSSPSNASGRINTSNQYNIRITGTCNRSGMIVDLYQGTNAQGTKLASTTCDGSQFSIFWNTSSFSDGNISVTVYAMENEENTVSRTINFNKDTSAPSAATNITNPTTLTAINALSYLVQGNCSEPGTTISFRAYPFFGYPVDKGTTTCQSDNTFSINLDFSTSPRNGTVDLAIQIMDSVGNLSSSEEITINKNVLPFLSEWRTTTPNEEIVLPLKSGAVYNFQVNYGDGTPLRTVTSFNDPDARYTYATPGTYNVSIFGICTALDGRGYTGYQTQLIEVDHLGNTGWTDLSYAFLDAENLTLVYRGDTRDVTNMKEMFRGAGSVRVYASVWDVSNVTDMSGMFRDASSARPATSTWNVSSVTDMSGMFWGANQAVPNVSSWDVSSVTNMANMFDYARRADPDVSSWDVSNVTDMRSMFNAATAANPDVSSWNVDNVTNMSEMFQYARLATPDVSSWNVNNVTDMRRMFLGARTANPDVSSWNVASVTDMSGMFRDATAAVPNVSSWNVGNVTNMANMFNGATSANPDVSSWNVSGITNMRSMFYNATTADPDVSSWNVSSVTNMAYMFWGATAADPDVSSWSVTNVTEMNGMFASATTADPDVSAWDVSNVTDMSDMFSLASAANPDVSSWDVGNVTNMSYMFSEANMTDPDTSSWDVSSVTNMEGMFWGNTTANPDVSSWDVGSVTNMSYLFSDTTNAIPDVSSWDVSSVTNMESMFYNATAADPDMSSWDWHDTNTIINVDFILDSGITSPNYSTLLIRLNSERPDFTQKAIDVGTVDYTAAAASSRTALEGVGWTFTDGAQIP